MSLADNYAPTKDLGNDSTVIYTAVWDPISTDYVKVFLEDVDTGVQTEIATFTPERLSNATLKVTLDNPATASNYVILTRDVPNAQGTTFTTSAGFQAKVAESTWDKAVAMVQQVVSLFTRTLNFPTGTSALISATIPIPEAGKALIGNATSDAFINSDTDISDLDSAVADAEAAAASADSDASSASDSAASAAVSESNASDSEDAAAQSAIDAAAYEVQTKIGDFSRVMTTASGDQVVSGLGFTPKAVIFFADISGTAGAASWGLDDGDGGKVMNDDWVNTNGTYEHAGGGIWIEPAAGARQTGVISAIADGQFTITWTKTGSPTGIASIKYLAIA